MKTDRKIQQRTIYKKDGEVVGMTEAFGNIEISIGGDNADIFDVTDISLDRAEEIKLDLSKGKKYTTKARKVGVLQ